MKKLIATLSLALLGVAPWTSAQAANYCDPCCDPCCTPCCSPCGSFEVGGEAIYWKACTDNQIFAISIREDDIVFGSNRLVLPVRVHPHKDRYEWGFRLFARYYTPDLCNYLGLEWTYFNHRKKEHFHRRNDEFIFLPCAIPIPWTEVWAKTKVDYNAVDLEAGHRLVFCGCGPSNSCDPCCGFSAYLFASLRYVDLCDDAFAKFRFDEDHKFGRFIDEIEFLSKTKRRFRGGGPRIGLRFRKDVWCGFGIVGKVATSLLVGSKRTKKVFKAWVEFENDTDVKDLSEDNPVRNFFNDEVHVELSFHASSGSICVPQIDAKLGVDYCFTCCGTFFIEAGWAWEHLWQGLANIDFDFLCVRKRSHDFGVGGPYIRAAYRF